MDMDERRHRIVEQPDDRRAGSAAVDDICVDHHRSGVKGANCQQAARQHFGHFADGRLGTHRIRAHIDGMAGSIGRIANKMSVVDQQQCVADRGVGEADATREAGVTRCHDTARALCRERIVVEREQRREARRIKGMNAKGHHRSPIGLGDD